MVTRVALLAYLFVVAVAATAGLPSAADAAQRDTTVAARGLEAGDDGDTLATDCDSDDDLDDAIADGDSDGSDDDAIPPAAGALVAPAGCIELTIQQQTPSPAPSLGTLFRPPCTASV